MKKIRLSIITILTVLAVSLMGQKVTHLDPNSQKNPVEIGKEANPIGDPQKNKDKTKKKKPRHIDGINK